MREEVSHSKRLGDGCDAIADVDLHARGIADASVHKPNAVEDRTHRPPLRLEVAVGEFLSGVIVTEVAVEADVREPIDELNCPPRVLSNRGPMGFDIERKIEVLRGLDHSLDERIH